jgi:hypothetical protein
MRLTLAFFAALVGTLAIVLIVEWRVDPFGANYDTRALELATAHSPPCLISDDLVRIDRGVDFKRDVLRLRHPSVIVFGTSRVLTLRSRAGESHFVNLGFPGTGPTTISSALALVRRFARKHVVMYIGTDLFWFNKNWEPFFDIRAGRKQIPVIERARTLLTRQNLAETGRALRDDPRIVFRKWHVLRHRGECFIDRGRRTIRGLTGAWRIDGSIATPQEIDMRFRREPARDFEAAFTPRRVDAFGGTYFGHWSSLDAGRIASLVTVLAQARKHGWFVVGFLPPYSSRYANELQHDARLAPRIAEYRATIPELYARYGFPFIDALHAGSIGCSDRDFLDDGWHISGDCGLKLRRRLDAVARIRRAREL